METTQRVVITGGPGTGKSTILQNIGHRGYPCHVEVSRAVIKEELARGSELLPWRDLTGFSDKVFQGQIAQYHEADEGKFNFYDRGMIDVIAYLKKDFHPTEALEELVNHYPYHEKIFLTPPWPEIYAQDTERREDFVAMQAIHEALVQAYQYFNYTVVEVPKLNTGERANFVLRNLGLL